MAKTKLIDRFPTPGEFEKLSNGKKAFWYVAISGLNWGGGILLAFWRWYYGNSSR